MRFTLEKAEKNLFAVYHTLYTNADTEMWFDWDRRLRDTTWTDESYFVLLDGRKVGGAIVTDRAIGNAFLIPPFCDRIAFWRFLLAQSGRSRVQGALDADADVLRMLGCRTDMTGQVMCRPADDMPRPLPEGFLCRALSLEEDAKEVAATLSRSYAGGICDAINGASTPESAEADLRRVCDIYVRRNTSRVLADAASGRIAAVCLSGVGEGYVHGYTEIADICVLPEYRRKGLAEYLIARAVSEARGVSPFVKLFVYVGNGAQYLYTKLGFIGGARFSNMTKWPEQAKGSMG